MVFKVTFESQSSLLEIKFNNNIMVRNDTHTTLQKLGLTYYETKAYCTLVKTGITNPAVIAEESGIPRTKIYAVLNKLEKNRWITIERTRPANVKPRHPKEIINEHKLRFNSELDEISNELSMVYDDMLEENITKIRVIRSPEKIVQITQNVMEKAKNKIVIMGSLYLPNGINLVKDQISKAKQRGVSVRVISEEFNRECNDFNYLNDFHSKIGCEKYIKNIIVDDKESIIMIAKIENDIPDINSIIILWITSPFVTSYISSIFDGEWEKWNRQLINNQLSV